MSASLIRRLLQSGPGKLVLKAIQPALHAVRRAWNPDLPNDQAITTVSLGERSLPLRHRRWSLSDALAIKQCFTDAQYDMPTGAQGQATQRIYREIVAEGRTPLILDCGANIGASVAWFALRYPEAHIVAVEPAPDNCEFLRRNTAGLNVEIHQAGVSGVDGQAYLINHYKGEQMGYQITSEVTETPVRLLSIATLLRGVPEGRYEPFLLKVDIEGAEKAVFAADTSAIDRFPVIILEPHDWMCPGEIPSREFFRYHAEAGREFAMKEENVASLRLDRVPLPA